VLDDVRIGQDITVGADQESRALAARRRQRGRNLAARCAVAETFE
jgi:hypothetical protein